jgi:hypothetical protein
MAVTAVRWGLRPGKAGECVGGEGLGIEREGARNVGIVLVEGGCVGVCWEGVSQVLMWAQHSRVSALC